MLPQCLDVGALGSRNVDIQYDLARAFIRIGPP